MKLNVSRNPVIILDFLVHIFIITIIFMPMAILFDYQDIVNFYKFMGTIIITKSIELIYVKIETKKSEFGKTIKEQKDIWLLIRTNLIGSVSMFIGLGATGLIITAGGFIFEMLNVYYIITRNVKK
jgi:hypothetical protein